MTANLRRGTENLTGLPVENLSMGGAFVRTPRPLHEGSEVAVGLVSPGKPRPIRLGGRVVSVSRGAGTTPAGMGISFEYCPPETAAELKELLMLHAPGPVVLDGDAADAQASRIVQGVALPPALTAKGIPASAAARLAVQVKWLLLELNDWRAQASMLESRNQALQAEVQRLLVALQRSQSQP